MRMRRSPPRSRSGEEKESTEKTPSQYAATGQKFISNKRQAVAIRLLAHKENSQKKGFFGFRIWEWNQEIVMRPVYHSRKF
jgi:hypothetical protein